MPPSAVTTTASLATRTGENPRAGCRPRLSMPWWRRRAPAGRFERFFDDVEAALPPNSSAPAASLVANHELWRMLPILGAAQLDTLLAAGKGAWTWAGEAPAAVPASEPTVEAGASQAQLEERLARLVDARCRELEATVIARLETGDATRTQQGGCLDGLSPPGEWTIIQIFWSIVIVVERCLFGYFVAFIR
jgi:hypothetical protein